jgi:hypothetical protein
VTGDHLTIDVLRYPDPLLVRAILMALGPSVLPSDLALAEPVLLVACNSATPGTRARSQTPLPGYHAKTTLRVLRSCSWRPLITAGHPVRPSVPSPSCNNPGFGTPPPHRLRTAARQFIPAGPFLISATRETIAIPSPNVYSSRYRFLWAWLRGSRPRTEQRTNRHRRRRPRRRRDRPLDVTARLIPDDVVAALLAQARNGGDDE